jgi:3D (Asp-Asp-Asp) domain-containing protein/peptidoglycan hydrolase CwlO-like protein
VGGQENTSLRRFLIFVVAALAIIAVPVASGAGSSPPTSSLQEQDAALAAKSRAAVLSLYSLDQQLATAQSRLSALRASLGELRLERVALKHELRIARVDTGIAQKALDNRLRQLYERGDVEPIEVLFGARNLTDALTSLDSLRRIASQDTSILTVLRGAKKRYLNASHTLTSRTRQAEYDVSQAVATADMLGRARLERSQYISSLAVKRRLTQQQISTLENSANAATQRSDQLTRERARTGIFGSSTGPTTSPVSFAQGRTMTVLATGYSLPGTTATGLPVGWGVAAVDPSVIPLGSHMIVPGYGEAVAADTGGAIIGDSIDLWFPTVAQALDWGRRVVTITVY